MSYEEVDDQAGFFDMFYHVKNHGGKVDKDCEFCKMWFINENEGEPLVSHRMIFLDFSKDKEDE